MSKSKKHQPQHQEPAPTLFQGNTYGRCYETHPKLTVAGGTLIGGNCGHPVTQDADVYVGFDSCWRQHGRLPWEEKPTINVYYPIQDGNVPQNVDRFKAMVKWLIENLSAGKTVHLGCIGGHGRTGLVIAAIIKEATGEADAITWTRANYCKKAAETDQQCKWLAEHFGITEVRGSRALTHDAGYQPPIAGGFQQNAGTYWQGKGSTALAEHQQKRAAQTGTKPVYDDGPTSIPSGKTITMLPPADAAPSIWTTARRENVEIQ